MNLPDGAQLVAPIYEPGSEVSNYSVVAGQISLDPQVSQQILSNPSGYSVGITGPNSTSLSQPLTVKPSSTNPCSTISLLTSFVSFFGGRKANVTGFLGLPSNLSINPTSEIQALYSIFGGNYASQTQVTVSLSINFKFQFFSGLLDFCCLFPGQDSLYLAPEELENKIPTQSPL